MTINLDLATSTWAHTVYPIKYAHSIYNNDANDKSLTTKLVDFDPVMDTVVIC